MSEKRFYTDGQYVMQKGEVWVVAGGEHSADVIATALEICKSYGFDFGGVYEHHSHYNCWLCPLQRKGELRWIFDNDKEKWDILRDMQYQTDGSYYPNETIFDCEKQFWKKHQNELRNKRMEARKKYNKR